MLLYIMSANPFNLNLNCIVQIQYLSPSLQSFFFFFFSSVYLLVYYSCFEVLKTTLFSKMTKRRVESTSHRNEKDTEPTTSHKNFTVQYLTSDRGLTVQLKSPFLFSLVKLRSLLKFYYTFIILSILGFITNLYHFFTDGL